VTGPPNKGSPLFAASAQGELERSVTFATVEGSQREVNSPTSTHSSGEPSFTVVRGKPSKTGPFGWYEKAATRRIREVFDDTGDVALANSVYLVLTEIASDTQTNSFSEKKAVIAARAGISPRKTQEILNKLCAAGIIGITRQKEGPNLNLPNVYTLFQVATARARKPVAGEPKKLGLTDEDWLASLKADKAYDGIDIEREFAKCRRWCSEHAQPPPSRKRFVNWLNRTDKPINYNERPSSSRDHSQGF
jgi:hypothetical protein